jgi:hypothetical protein
LRGVKASIKYHDAATNNPIIANFTLTAGWQDIGPDGIIESTNIQEVTYVLTVRQGQLKSRYGRAHQAHKP